MPSRRIGHPGQAILAAVLLVVMAFLLERSKPAGQWRPGVAWIDVFRPGAGFEIALPRDARDAIALIRGFKLRRFEVGPALRSNVLVVQRIVEGAYPLRRSRQADDLIEFFDHVDRKACRVIGARGKMAYVRCRDR